MSEAAAVLDGAYAPDECAAWAAEREPWDSILSSFGELDPALLSDTGRVDLLVALKRQQAWNDAQQQRVLASMAAQPVSREANRAELDKHWVREDVACALRVPASTARARLELATELVERLPDTLALLHRGAITMAHATGLAERVRGLDEATARAVEARVLPAADTQTAAQFIRCVRRAVFDLDSRPAEQREGDARDGRRVWMRPGENGMGELGAELSADDAVAVWAAICRRARASHDGVRTLAQRRADALVELITGIAVDGTGVVNGTGFTVGRRPAVRVTVARSTLLGLDDQPGELDGFGPIPADLARRIAADPTGTWRRLVTDPMGRLLDYGRTSYRVPADLADHITARDLSCRFFTCDHPAADSEADHIVAWDDDGDTREPNLHRLCPRDHHLKHEAGWTVARSPDGDTVWVSRTGHRYVKPPEMLPIDRTPRFSVGEAVDDLDPPPF
jgi:hypothetical protein